MSTDTTEEIEGAILHHLIPHGDDRGSVVEIWRASTPSDVVPRQWNVVQSESGVLRGVHVHRRHGDYLMLAEGAAVIGLHDLRPSSPSAGRSVMVELRAGTAALEIPPGVAHGFCFTEASIHVYAVSHYFDPADELGCRYDDPALGFDWPVTDPQTSERDQHLPSLDELIQELRAPASGARRSV